MKNLTKAFDYYNNEPEQLLVFKTEKLFKICVADEKLAKGIMSILKNKCVSTQYEKFVCIDVPLDQEVLSGIISNGYNVCVISHRNKNNELCIPDIDMVEDDMEYDY